MSALDQVIQIAAARGCTEAEKAAVASTISFQVLLQLTCAALTGLLARHPESHFKSYDMAQAAVSLAVECRAFLEEEVARG